MAARTEVAPSTDPPQQATAGDPEDPDWHDNLVACREVTVEVAIEVFAAVAVLTAGRDPLLIRGRGCMTPGRLAREA